MISLSVSQDDIERTCSFVTFTCFYMGDEEL